MNFILSIIKSFFKDDCVNLAANISFCALLSIIPVAMIMVSIAGYFLGGSADAYDQIVSVATDFLPVGREVFIKNLQSILDQRSSLGIVGMGFLIFIATILLASVERALDRIFKSSASRNFFHSRLLGIALIFWVTLLFALPTMASILEGLLHRYGFGFPLSSLMSGRAYIFLVSFLAFIMTVVIIPNLKIYIRYAAVGGLFFAVGIGVVKYIFRWYMLLSLERYNVIYGTLATVVTFLAWIFYLAVVLLLAAEFTSELQKRMWFHPKQMRRESKTP